MNADAFDDTYTKYDEDGGFTISIHDMTNKKRDRFSPEVVDRILAEYGYTDLEFSPYALHRLFLKEG